MVLSKRIARFNRVATNRVTKYVVNWMPSFGMLVHQGRRSGKEYRTPINLFRTPDGFVFALTYGPDADWVKNVLAADGCVVHTRRRDHRVHSPKLVHDESREAMPPVVRQFLGLIDVQDFLYVKRE